MTGVAVGACVGASVVGLAVVDKAGEAVVVGACVGEAVVVGTAVVYDGAVVVAGEPPSVGKVVVV
jgi:hypothetical protein